MKIISLRSTLWTWVAFMLTLIPLMSYAEGNKLTIVNHYTQSLTIIIGINPETLSDVPATFSLAPNEQKQTTVVDRAPEAYIRAEDNDKNFAFWGVEFVNQLKIYGYMSRGIAFSWRDNAITFCTPEVYKQHHAC